MRCYVSKIVALSLMLAACASTKPKATAPGAAEQMAANPAARTGLRIGLTTIYVDDQDKALRFYTEVLGFAKKEDVSNGGYRWLTVTAAGERDGTSLQLALAATPATKAYQKALFEQSQPAVMFFTDDVKGEAERIKARGAELTMPPTEVMPGSTITMLKDGCGNLIQITQLDH